MAGSGCTTPGMHRAVQQNLQAPNSWPKVLSVYMPWFGDHVHMDVGYSSDDPAVLRRQIQQARHSGISAFVVDWYGTAVRSFSFSPNMATWIGTVSPNIAAHGKLRRFSSTKMSRPRSLPPISLGYTHGCSPGKRDGHPMAAIGVSNIWTISTKA